jgi:GT2 family glycosyltransferase/glycosyltransferase involved in cell wall biosynthesis
MNTIHEGYTLIDIVIVNFNSTDFLLKCLESVYEALGDYPATVRIQDNASSDRIHRITERFPAVILTRNERNIGFASAVNQGLQQSTSPYVILLNPDSYVLKDFFCNILSFMERNPQIGIAGPRILDRDGSVQGSARAFPTALTSLFGRASLLTRLFPNNPITSANLLTRHCDGVNPMEVDWVSGACMIVRKKAIDAVGVFDERFFMYWEDADWCRRMRDSGWQVVYFPQASVVHYVGGSSNQLVFKSQVAFHKSAYLLFEKHNPSVPLFIKFVVMIGLFYRLCLVAASNSKFLHLVPEKRLCSPSLSMDGKRKIKILRIIARLNIGGPAIHVHLLTTGLHPEHYETILVTGSISDKEGDMSYLFQGDLYQHCRISVLKRDIDLSMDIRVTYRIFRLLCQIRPDIVHTHTAKAGFTARTAAFIYNLVSRNKIKIAHTFHGHIFEGYFSRWKSGLFAHIERFIARGTDVIIAISESQRKELAEKYHIAPLEKIRVIELGFDLSPFLSCAARKGCFRKKLGVGDETVLVGIIGRLVPIKNHEMLFKAIRLFLKSNPGIDMKLVVVGDGECHNQLEAYCREHHLTRHVVFWGWIQDVSLVYADLDILALTSLSEGTPVSIIEAMASSVPVIATHVGGVQDLMGKPVDSTDGERGFTVCERGILSPSNESVSFFKGLTYLVREGSTAKQARIQHARTYVVERFAKERLLKDVELLYSQLMAKEKK